MDKDTPLSELVLEARSRAKAAIDLVPPELLTEIRSRSKAAIVRSEKAAAASLAIERQAHQLIGGLSNSVLFFSLRRFTQ